MIPRRALAGARRWALVVVVALLVAPVALLALQGLLGAPEASPALLGHRCLPLALGPGVDVPEVAKAGARVASLVAWARTREFRPSTGAELATARTATVHWHDAHGGGFLVATTTAPTGPSRARDVWRAVATTAEHLVAVHAPRAAVIVGGRVVAAADTTGCVLLVDDASAAGVR